MIRKAAGGCLVFAALSLMSWAEDTAGGSGWKVLPKLPDPVGFAGMFAGVTEDGALFAGGGSRFIDKPVWNGGKKVFGDRVFVLKNADGPWKVLGDTLPNEVAHMAAAAFGNEVICVGGVNGEGALRNVWAVGVKKGALKVRELASLPQTLVYGAAAVVDDVIYVVGGVRDASSTEPGKECWALDLRAENEGWKRVRDFPGRPGIVMAAGGDGKRLYVFGGMHYVPGDDGKAKPVPSNDAYRYDPESDSWARLADLPVARVGAASPCPVMSNGDLLVAGGYGAVFPGAQKEHPGFERETWIYEVANDRWREGVPLPCERKPDPESPTSPGPEPMVAAPAVIWKDMAVIVSGEVRPATRTPAVIGLPLSDDRVGEDVEK